MEAPDGWLQSIRGVPHPSETCNGSSSACESRFGQSHTAQERARKLEKALEVMSDVEGPAVEALHAELKGSERCFSADIGRADSAVRIFHHEVQTAVARDRRATSCRGVVDRSQGQRSEMIAEPPVLPDWEAEVKRLLQQMTELQCQKPLYSRV